MMDYVTLKLIWWGIFGFLIIAFTVTGGMDIGVNFLLPIIGHTDNDRRLMLNAIGPTWEGNQVWLVTLGAGLFAIWPIAYGTIFSSMYLPFMLVLLMLILRPPGFDYRGKINSHIWRNIWDLALFVGSIVMALSFGVVIGILFTGLPFSFDSDMHEIFTGSFFDMIPPSALVFGVANLCMMGVQGALFLQYKLEGVLAERAKLMTKILGLGFFVSAIFAGIYVCLWIPGYHILSIPDLNTSFMVTDKVVVTVLSGWAHNFAVYRFLWIFPIVALLATRIAIRLSSKDKPLAAIFTHSLGIAFTVATVGCSLFPFILPSSTLADHSLTIWDVCSSKLTLQWALFAVILFLPIILTYTTWVYRVMRGKVKLTAESY